MTDFQEVQRAHVLQAIAEHDEVGAEAFRRYYGYGPAQGYALTYEGRTYDSKAIAGVAQRFAAGRPLTRDEFSGGKEAALKLLRSLDFEVDGPDVADRIATTAAAVGQEHARATWALAARERLVDAAENYGTVVTYKELAAFVQQRSLISTQQLTHQWIGDVLGRVCESCAADGEPFLPSLCVDAKGQVGAWYATAVEKHRGELVGDPDDHAAAERLECHRYFGAALPPGGGEPTLTTQVARRRDRVPSSAKPRRATATIERPLVTCAVHFQVLPPSGVCDLCE